MKDKFEKIIQSISEGNSLRSVLLKMKISSRTFYEYLEAKEPEAKKKSEKERNEAKEDRQKRYARACEEREEILFEEILDIADKPLKAIQKETIEKMYNGKKVKEVTIKEGDAIDRSRLQVDARKWVLSKMNPKKYGNKTELAGEVGLNVSPVVLEVQVNKKSDDQFEEETK